MIWVFTVCPDQSVRKLRITTVGISNNRYNEKEIPFFHDVHVGVSVRNWVIRGKMSIIALI